MRAHLSLITGCGLVGGVLFFSVLAVVEDDLLPLLLLWLFIAPAVWTLLHALVNGVPGAFFWAMLALFANVIGMIVYILYSGRPGNRPCPECHVRIASRFRWCPWCGCKMGD